jgi:hypothetical protein
MCKALFVKQMAALPHASTCTYTAVAHQILVCTFSVLMSDTVYHVTHIYYTTVDNAILIQAVKTVPGSVPGSIDAENFDAVGKGNIHNTYTPNHILLCSILCSLHVQPEALSLISSIVGLTTSAVKCAVLL